MKKKVFAVLSGGGTKGAALLGAIEEAEKSVDIIGWGGTSAGSIVAALLACGYDVEELRDLLYQAPYAEFFSISLKRLLLYKFDRGLVNPKPLLEWLRKQIAKKFPQLKRVRFQDLDNRNLKIVATNLTSQEIVVYSAHTSAELEIAQAVLASCSFPFIFPPVHVNADVVVDGGVFSNFPMWLFFDEEEKQTEFTPVLGFALVSREKERDSTTLVTHALSVLNSLMVAQDRVQEKYMDSARLSNVIRIDVTNYSTFSDEYNANEKDALILAGKEAAQKYFKSVSENYGERVDVPYIEMSTKVIQSHLYYRRYSQALSAIARTHIFHGGVARDDGIADDRVFVKYYIDLMEAASDQDELEYLSEILAARINLAMNNGHIGQFSRVIGIKKGNIILSHTVARKLNKPFSVFKTDMSYKMGQPFDGQVVQGERVIIVDDISSDASLLKNAVRNLNLYHATVLSIFTLIDRTEGDAKTKISQDKNVPIISVCSVNDTAIGDLIFKNVPFPEST